MLVLPPEDPCAAEQSGGSQATSEPTPHSFGSMPPTAAARGWPSSSLAANRLALPERADDDRRLIAERLADLAESFDLAEPFQRIRDAIEEAQQAVR